MTSTEPVTTYRVGWAPPAFMVWRILRLAVTGAGPQMSRRLFWRLAREDLPSYARRSLRSIARDGLVPPWQAERTADGCMCNAARGWTGAQAVRRVEAMHAERVRAHRCEADRPTLRAV